MLPHFGDLVSRDSILGGAREAELLGFDSLWLRDHVVYRAHPWESSDLTFIDPFVAMSAIAGATQRIKLGTGALIPHRHPIHLAVLIGSLDLVAGRGRVVVGMGLGSSDAEFVAIGMGDWDRREVWREQMEIIRKLWDGGLTSHEGRYYAFSDVQIRPIPAADSVPIWYCGPSDAAVRRAVEMCEGWGPVIQPRRDLQKKLELMERLAARSERPVPTVAVRAEVSPARTVEEGARKLNLAQHLAHANKVYSAPPSGAFRRLSDLDGVLIAGPPEVIAEEIQRYADLGVDHFIFDLRGRAADWRACLDTIGSDVLPRLAVAA